MSQIQSAGDLPSARRGSYVRVAGVIRSVAPIEAPFTNDSLVGYDFACSVFHGQPPSYVSTVHVVVWRDAILTDDSGEVVLALERSHVRTPAGAERTIEEEPEIARALRKLSLQMETPTQLQILERSVVNECFATVSGTVDVMSAGAFRSSARPRVILRGDRQRPLVVVPR